MAVNTLESGTRITFGKNTLEVIDTRLFSAGKMEESRRFSRRVFDLPEVISVDLHPEKQSGCVHFRVKKDDRRSFAERLISAVRGGTSVADTHFPFWPEGTPVTLRRYGNWISTFKVLSSAPGRFHLFHPAIHNTSLAKQVEEVLRQEPGVKKVTATPSSGKLWIAFDSQMAPSEEVLRSAERALIPATASLPVVHEKPVDFRIANTTVGLATVGELVLPLATPLCAGLLVVTNLKMLKEAGGQVLQGKLGTPVWMTALLACSIASGQVLAYALTDWSFRYWTRRWRREAAARTRLLHQDTVPVPSHVRFRTPDGIEVLTPVQQIRPGQSLFVAAGEVLPVDGKVVSGAALVHETPLSGVPSPVRKGPGDEVYAGSTVTEGRISIEILRTGGNTRAAQIAQTLFRTATALPDDQTLQKKAIGLTDRTVVPTLATAGVGLAMGNLFIVGAVLHQDWLSGAELAVPLATLRDIRVAAHAGAVICKPDALQRLTESRFIVIQDQPLIHRPQLALSAIRSAVPDIDNLLSYVAGAGLYVGDQRAAALARACQERGVIVRQPELIAIEPEAVTVRIGTHRLVVRGESVHSNEEKITHLVAEIDGVEAAWFEFKRTSRKQAADAIGRLHQLGFQVFLVSSRPEAEVSVLAEGLGISGFSGDLTSEQQVHFLEGLTRRGVRPTWVGAGPIEPLISATAHATITLGCDLSEESLPDIAILGEYLDPLSDVAALSGENATRIRQFCRKAMVPNLLCVVGAFAGLLNGITAGILANIAVLNVYRSATASLQSLPQNTRRISAQ